MTDDSPLLAPYVYITNNPGKGIRSTIMRGFNLWLKISDSDFNVIESIIEMLHNASLLLDDIEDGSLMRRGLPVAHTIFGVPQTINCANMVCFLALQEVQKLNRQECIVIFTEEMLNLHRGQGLEIYWRDCFIAPTEEEYLNMIRNKTGGLIRLGIRLMEACSTSTTSYIDYVNLLGTHFQIRDDYINLKSPEYMKEKTFCEDLTEGKYSFPIIHSVHNNPSNRELIDILKKRPVDIALKTYALSLMEKTKSFEYTRNYLSKLEEKLEEDLEILGGNDILKKIVESLSIEKIK